MTDVGPSERRLRAFALRVLRSRSNDHDLKGDALLALAEELDAAAWTRWNEVSGAAEDQWFAWRDPGDSDSLHADQAITGGSGRIRGKYSSGLDFSPECQPLRFAKDVIRALAQADVL